MSDSSQNNKRIAKNTLLLYVRMLITMCISIYTSRIVLDTLGEIDYGIYNVVGGFVTMFAVISGAMTTATQRFISYEIGRGKEGDVTSLFSTAVIIHVFLAFVIFIAAETIGLWFLNTQMNFPSDRYEAANWVFQLSVLTFIINVISVPYNAAIVAYEKMSAFAYISIIEVVLKLLIVYLLVISCFDKLILYAIFLAIIAIAIRITYGIYCHHYFPLCKSTWKVNKEYRNKMFSFVSWNLIGSVAMIAKEQGINVLLNIFFGAAVNAARGVAYQVLNALHGFVGNFQLAMNPQIVKSYAANEKKSMYQLVFRGSKFSFFLMFVISLPFIIEAPYILSVWLKQVPQYADVFLRIVLATSIISSLSGTLITSMHASGFVRDYQIIVGGISLLTLPLAYVLLKLGLPPYSALLSSFGVEGVCHIARVILLKRTIQFPAMKYFREVTLRVFLVSTLSLIIPLIIYTILPIDFLSFLTVGIVSVLCSLSCSFIIGLDSHEKILVVNAVNKIKSRIIHK